MAGPGTRTASIIIATLSLILAAVSPACSSGPDQGSARLATPSQGPNLATTKTPSWIICGSYTSVDDTGQKVQKPEYYILRAMNRKLEYFPAFASSIGMTSVSTCDEAHTFSHAYQRYFAAHPYFDRDLPSDATLPLPKPVAERALATVPKIFNGGFTGPSDTNLFPVVHIQYTLPPGQRFHNGDTACGDVDQPGCTFHCSGTFIARNWILTAAHCFDDEAMTFSPEADPGWLTDWWNPSAPEGSRGWQIDWPDSQGLVSGSNPPGGAHTLSDLHVWTIANPNYIGLCGSGPNCETLPTPQFDWDPSLPKRGKVGEGYDVGLLYLYPPENDGNLAASAEKSSWPLQMELMDSLVSGWTLKMYGYGPTVEPAVPPPIGPLPPLRLTVGEPEGSVTLGSSLVQDVIQSQVPNTINSGDAFQALCKGDSGGPLIRTTTAIDGNGKAFEQTIIVGVASLIVSPHYCGFTQGSTLQWSRVDFIWPWILQTMQQWYNFDGFQPNILADLNGTNAFSYGQFWGQPCQTDCDCPSAQRCDNPVTGKDTIWGAGCPTCGQGNGCKCMVGQCLPQSKATAITSGVLSCSGKCTDTQTDGSNCGACGHVCNPGTSCVAGSCM